MIFDMRNVQGYFAGPGLAFVYRGETVGGGGIVVVVAGGGRMLLMGTGV